MIKFKCLNCKYVINSVGKLQFGIKKLLHVVSSTVFLLTGLHWYMTQYQVFDCTTFFCAVVGLLNTLTTCNFLGRVLQKKQQKGQDLGHHL